MRRVHLWSEKGFTLIELIITIAIIVALGFFARASFFGQNNQSTLNNTTNQIIASARQAQSNSGAQLENVTWGIHFSNATNTIPFYAVFTGASYATGTVQSSYPLPPTIGYVSSTLPMGSSQDVIFSPISGASSVSTTIAFYVVSQPSLSSSIAIAASGRIGTAAVYVAGSGGGSGGSGTSTQYMWFAPNSNDSVVQKFDLNFNYISQFGSHGSGNGQFGIVQGIAVASNGNIYVGDSAERVEIFNASGTYISQFGSAGSGNGQFAGVAGVAIGSTGNVYVVDENNNRVEIFNASGTYISQFGSAGSGNGQFSSPQSILVNSATGNVYVEDFSNYRVEIFNASGTYISQFGSDGSGNGQFGSVYGIALDASGSIYVADSDNNRVEIFNASGTYISQFGSAGSGTGQFNGPGGIALDASGNIYVSDGFNFRMEKFDHNHNYLSENTSTNAEGFVTIH